MEAFCYAVRLIGNPDWNSRATDHQLRDLDSLPLGDAHQVARRHLEGRAPLWDWDEDVDLIGVARVVAVLIQ